jgi:hypothetical protein
MKHRPALAGVVHAVEHETMEMNIEIGGGTKTLDERDRARVSFAAFDASLLDQKAGDDAVDHPQHG